ncbi:hypothetical protein SS1G_03969 [Sclerotinia sclerotiorum 1980 UF-70]|uniref:C2H2-type domain-containing protein n=1 Tax=Sclerotinia sclerotiorum (strain ATCC 18683 / 1980 / Ss-1) TaxID=665079 RepID=A7EF78_SCLS1|nr:hypothetical protein SS1G_03969 [Sclerotinia sclerotiorum 1980 UF-70]EDO01494.1 hypothetical protein SS1G_03969 [Sclerotinia sclerotiorum 1980 UF-70]
MDIPIRGQMPGFNTPLPEICVQDSHHPDRYPDRYSDEHRYHSTTSSAAAPGPMSIPNAREAPPPPLPPPRYIPDIADNGRGDLGWQWANQHREVNWEGRLSAVAPGSSLYGSYNRKSISDDRPDVARRGSSNATITAHTSKDASNHLSALPKDEGYASLSASNASIGSTQSKTSIGFQSSVHDAFQTSAQAYDQSLLQKLGGRGDNFTQSRPFAKSTFSSSVNDVSPTSRIAREHGHPALKPLSLPIHTHKPALAESPINRWADSPLSSGVSPGNPYTRLSLNTFDYRSPTDIIDNERSSLHYPRRSGSIADDASSIASQSRDSFHMPSPEYEEGFHMEETGLRRLQIGEEYHGRSEGYSPGSATAGQKRRASSPPRDDGLHLRTVGSASDLARRLAASSATSLGSYVRLSHGGLPPAPMDINPDMSYNGSISLNPSPRGSISARTAHHRALSESRPLTNARKMPEVLGHVKHNSAPSRQGGFICVCCPKKPKKFDTQEELNAHEQEKQYECLYCPNRFKNKNEAERHQNSLHLRRHSWSCAALQDWAHAFHPSPSRPNDADTCGYCGEDFLRSGFTNHEGSPIPAATGEDWEIRGAHLQDMHKFGECNHAKKFFRADHFRQHLKHSHAGTSGKWTNMLENACMIDEPPPEPLRGPERVSPGGVRVGRINEEDEIL